MALTVDDLRKKYYGEKNTSTGKTVEDLRQQYYAGKNPSPAAPAVSRERAESREEERSKTAGFEVVKPFAVQNPVSTPAVQNKNPRAQTVAERAARKPASANPRAKGNNAGDTSTRFGKGLQSIGLSAPAAIEYLGESTMQARENAADYQNSEWKAQADAALNAIKLARTLYGEGSEEHLKAQADYNALRENIAAYQTAPEKAVDMDSRAAQFMGGVQQLQEEALEGTSGAGRFLGEAALSIGSNLAKLPLNAVLPGASLALMGAEAAAGKAYELGQRGVSAGEALTRGVVSGGIEALTEKIPLDNLMDIIKSGSKAGLMTLVKQAATEGGEEGVAYLLNLLADKAAGDEEAQFELREFAKSIGMGALSGGILGGGAVLLNRAGNVTAANDPAELAVQMLLRGEEISGKQAKRIMESDSAIAALQEAAGITINRNAPASQVKAQIRSVGRDRAANTGAPVQTPGQAEMPVQPAGAVLEEAAMEMAEEQTRKETNVREAVANRSAMPYTETRQNTEGGMNGGEEVSLRESSQWNDRADPGREVPRMEEGAGRDPGGQDPRFRPKDGGAAGLRIEKQVSTAALGIGGGASNDGVYVVSGGDTEATAKARTLAKERGLRLTLFTGGNLHINGEECRAYITGDRVFVRADHNEFDAYQLIRHEAGHDQIAKGEIDIKAAIENVRTRLGDEGSVKRAVQTYASAFAGADMTVDEALEEIICDSLGDMNVFSGTEVEAEFSEVLDEARAAAGESRVESKTGPPVEGKASVDKEDLAVLGVEEVKGTVVKASRESWSKTDKQRLLGDLVKAGFSENDSRKWIEDVNSVSAIIAADADRLDYAAADNQRMLKDNDEYVTTLDASTLCAKRLLYQGTYNAIQHALPNVPLTSDDVVNIRKMMADAGYEVPCGICYVESRRRTLGKYAEEWLKGYQAQGYQPKLEDVTTTDGLERMRKEHPEVYDSFVAAMKKKGTANPKVVELRTDYREDIRRLTKGQIAKEIRIGGQRIQSFSDFETPHLIDTMQAILDMAHVGLTAQAYTKVPNFAWVFGDTGVKINLSLIGDVDAQGNLVFDGKEGMPIEDAMALRERYSENVGTILVGRNDKHILAAMADSRVDYIIPFHRSGWGQAQYEQLGLKGYQDYTLQQSERMVDGSKPKGGNLYPIDYWDYSKSGTENARRYLEICAEQGRVPKFSKFLVNNGDGSYSLQPDGSTDGYWKLLIDFKMYDNEGNGAPQRKVTPTFNMEEARRVLAEYDGDPNSLPVAQDIVDRFVGQKQGSASRDAKREDVLRAVEQLLQEYGAIEPGENPFRSVQVPKQTGESKNVSKTVRTILEAEATPEAIIPNIEELVADGALSFESYTDEQAIADATAKLQGKGWSKTLSNWLRDVDRGIVSKENTVTGWALYNNAANSGDTDTALTILEKMVGHQRNAAQALQATRVLKKLSPEAQLYGVQRSIEDLQEELNDRYGQDKAPKLKVDPELGEKFLRAKTDKDRDDALGEIYRDVGRQIPSRFRDKWNAWRYLAMLGNPRTHVRNVVGNAGFAPLVAAKNLTATAIESAVSRVSGGRMDRTKAFVGAGRQDRELLRAAWSDFANVKEAVSGEGKYTDLQQENKQVREGQVIFKNKLLEKARKKNSEWMEREDAWFSQPHYAAALAGYCKANGITAQQIAVGEGLDKARAYAVKEAQKATYRDSNYLSQVFGEIGGRWRYDKRNPLKRGVGMLVEGILPFRKTPANILARGVEYSPIGLMNGIKKAVWDVQNEKATAAEAIDNISAGLTGTGLMALGVFLAAQGLVRGRGEDDEKEKSFAELQGHQAYSMELPNGTSVTLDWLAPEALPFFVGVNFWEMTEGDAEEVNMESILGAVTSVTEPLMEMSCLQSLNDLFDSVGYASNNDLNSLMSVLVSAATSYVTQAIPTLGGQIERSMQRERMTTYTDKNKWISTDMQYAIGSATSRIPGIDYGQIPYIDAWGRAESTGGLAENAFNNLINPSYTSRIDTSAMEEELLRLYRATGESVFPGRAARYFYVNGDRKDLTAEEYVQYATRKGQISFEMLTELVNSSTYKQLSDVEKAKMVSEVYTNANQQAKSEVSDYEADDWAAKYLEAEKKYGIKQETFAEVRMRTRFLSSLKDQSGETIDNSLSLLKMEAVYEMPGLTDKQRQALFEYLGVGKTVRHYNKSLVQSKLKSMRKKAK